MSVADAKVKGAISNGTLKAFFEAVVSCNGTPTGKLQGVIKNVFTGGPQLSTFAFQADSARLVGTLKNSGFVHAVFDNVLVKNKTTNQSYTDCFAVLTAIRLTADSWQGSLTIICCEGPVLTLFGEFSGSVTVNREVLCQPLL